MNTKGMMRQSTVPQPDCHEVFFTVEADGTIASNGEGEGEVTSAKNATGDYTITPTLPGSRVVSVRNPIPFTANLQCQLVASTDSTNAVNVKFTNNSGTATDTRFMGSMVISYDILRRA